jgi:hypothetical protein
MNASGSCGLDSDIGFTKCCRMRALAHECLGVPVVLLQGGCKSMVF